MTTVQPGCGWINGRLHRWRCGFPSIGVPVPAGSVCPGVPPGGYCFPVQTLVIQIPCFNEAETLPRVMADLPRDVPGFDQVSVLVIDDGSTDRTVEVAEAHGARVLSLGTNRGLAAAFAMGLEEALAMGAAVIVNLDGDNQYVAADIPKLVAPLRDQRNAMVVGCRDIAGHAEFGVLKKRLQELGSWTVSRLAHVRVPDVTSGFRAFTREAALRLLVTSRFTYTQETLIQAGHEGIAVLSVYVRVNPSTRPSRLMRSIPHYVMTSAATIVRAYTMYASMRVFTMLAAAFVLLGLAGVGRFLYYYLSDPTYSGFVQSLVISAALLVLGVQTFFMGVLADLVASSRKLTEDLLYRQKRADTRARAREAQEATHRPGSRPALRSLKG